MVIIESYIQPRILRAILSNGGEATSREIIKMTGMKGTTVSKGGFYLNSRGIVKKTTIHIMENNMPHKLNVYTLVEKRMYDVHRVIGQMPEGWQK